MMGFQMETVEVDLSSFVLGNQQIQNPKIRCEATNELETDLNRSSLTSVRLEPFGILIESSAVGFGDTSSLYRSTS
jgi:C4-type Zn-finger protein